MSRELCGCRDDSMTYCEALVHREMRRPLSIQSFANT
jgi:hypothetical protein